VGQVAERPDARSARRRRRQAEGLVRRHRQGPLLRARKLLIANASKAADLAAKLSLLQELDTELRDLFTRPLDEIAQTDLDAILERYADVVDEATKAALDQFITDLQQSVTDLQHELWSLIDNFGAQADAVADLATGAARDAEWNPDDPSSYGLALTTCDHASQEERLKSSTIKPTAWAYAPEPS
jgi:hypothetical protein